MKAREVILPALWGTCLALTACSTVPQSAPTPPVPFAHDAYPTVFDAARRALSEFRFTLDRVDAARGVITTQPKPTAGLATPWDAEQSSLGQEARDLAHQHERVTRVVFEPADAPETVRVWVVINRVRRPGWRIESDALGWSTHARNPAARRNGGEPEFREPIREDRALAERILARIRELAGLGGDGG